MLNRTGLSRATQARLEAAGQFPGRVQLGPNSVGWIEEEVEQWIESRRVRRRASVTEQISPTTQTNAAGSQPAAFSIPEDDPTATKDHRDADATA